MSDPQDDYCKKLNEAEEKLQPMLTDEFLKTLEQAVKTCGWTVDHIESSSFVRWCFGLAGKEDPDTNPFDYDVKEIDNE